MSKLETGTIRRASEGEYPAIIEQQAKVIAGLEARIAELEGEVAHIHAQIASAMMFIGAIQTDGLEFFQTESSEAVCAYQDRVKTKAIAASKVLFSIHDTQEPDHG